MAERRKDLDEIRTKRDQHEHFLRLRNLVPVGRINYAWTKTTDPEPLPSVFSYTVRALQILDLPYEIHLTRKPHLRTGFQKELWVTRETHGALFTVHTAQAYFSHPGFVEIARRFALQPEALIVIDTAIRLGLTKNSNGIRPLFDLVRKPTRSTSLISALREIRRAS